MNQKRKAEHDDLLPEYDFTGAVRGKYYQRYRQGTNVVLLDPDIAAVFRDSAAVNDTLRLLVSLAWISTDGNCPNTGWHCLDFLTRSAGVASRSTTGRTPAC